MQRKLRQSQNFQNFLFLCSANNQTLSLGNLGNSTYSPPFLVAKITGMPVTELSARSCE